MRKLTSITIIFLLVGGCSRTPSTDELAKKYNSDPSAFETMSHMIREDTKSRGCFEVGIDHIGDFVKNDYWEYDGKWTKKNEFEKLNLESVLKAVGLSEKRYIKYKQLFSVAGAERVSFCQGGKVGPWVSVLIYRSGLAVSGCSGSIDWRKHMPVSKGKRGNGDFTEITPLKNGWYLDFDCT